MIFFLIVLFALAIIFSNSMGSASAATLASTPQPKFNHDNNNTGQSQYNGPTTNTTKWKYRTGNSIYVSSPAIGSDGTIYIGSMDDNLYAINPTGTLKWKYLTDDSIESSPAIGSDGTIYIGTLNDSLYAINPTGTLKWKYSTDDSIASSPAIGSDGTIYIGSIDNYLYAINPTGTLKWKYQTGNYITSSPAIGSDGTIYVGSMDDNLYSISSIGTLKWKYLTGSYITSSPAIGSDGTIYVGSTDHNLYAISSIGTLKWKYLTGDSIDSPAIGSDGTIYVGSTDHNLYAISSIGTLKWKYLTGSYITSSPAIGSDGTIYVGSTDHNLYAISSIGTLKWKYLTGSYITSSPAIGSDGTIYIGSTDDNLYAISDIDVSANPVGGFYSIQQITLTTNLPGTIYWEMYSSNFNTGWTTYNSPITITKSCNLAFYAMDSSGNTSPLNTETYTINYPPPTITATPTNGIYTNTKEVILSTTSDSTTTTYYTTDGTNPQTSGTRNIYTKPLIISTTTTLRFSALDSIGQWSPYYTETYIIDTSAPIITAKPKGGIYNTTNIVTLTTKDPDSTTTTYFTTDGTNPQTSGTRNIYTKPLIISTTTTLRFSAIDTAGNKSPIYTYKYTIDKTPPKVSSTTPTNLKTGVSRTNTIYIKFSENIKSGIYFNNIGIKNLSTNKYITITPSISGSTIILKTTKNSKHMVHSHHT